MTKSNGELQSPAINDVVLMLSELFVLRGIVHVVNSIARTEIDGVDGGRWMIAVNGFNETKSVDPPGCMPADIPAFNMGVWWNGWLAGILPPIGGFPFVNGGMANLETFIAAIRVALDAAKARN